MTNYSKINIVYRLQKWMDSVPGQTFLNYAYSWGASIVILGTLFKLTHLPGADIMLFLGMNAFQVNPLAWGRYHVVLGHGHRGRGFLPLRF